MLHCALDSKRMSEAVRSLQEAGLVELVSSDDLKEKEKLGEGFHLRSLVKKK